MQEDTADARPKRRLWLVVMGLGALVLSAVLLRSALLGHVPGINGDEAWYGVRIAEGLTKGPGWWKTPTGNLLNPFYLVPLALFQKLFAPALWSLRSVSFLSGLLGILVAYGVIRKRLGANAATLAATVMAFLPANIAYSRFGWDASQSVLSLWLVLGAVLQGRYVWGVVALLAALVVHPTNIFVVPTVFIVVVQRELLKGRLTRRRFALIALALGVLGVVVFYHFRASLPLSRILGNVFSAGAWAESFRLFVQLFSGTTIYRYISGDGGGLDARLLDVIWAMILFASLIVGPLHAFSRKQWELVAWPLGVVASFLAFHLLVGPLGLRPGFERYSFWMIAPVLLTLFLQIQTLWPRVLDQPRKVYGVAFVIAVVFGASFMNHYFLEFTTSGGHAHRTFRTSAIEPKLLVYERIKEDRKTYRGPVRVYASSWWTYQTLRYLMIYGGDLERGDEIIMVDKRKGGIRFRFDRRTYFVTFVGEGLDRFIRAHPVLIDARLVIYDGEQRPLLRVYRLRSPPKSP